MRVWYYLDGEGEQFFTTEKRARAAYSKDSRAISEPKELNFTNRAMLVRFLNIKLGGG